ncbi:MAG: hypothetical protein ACHQII_03350 [Bacteroidia bacterium]
MARVRGLRRYYKNLATQIDSDKISRLNFSDQNIWFDNWHLHFDWKGFGNNSFKRRKPHLDKLFRHFDLLAEKTKLLKTDFQLYSVLLDFDSSNDALFLHTPNPNHKNFPYKFENLSPNNNLINRDLENYIASLKGYTILFGKAEENYCVIYKDKLGAALI